jgi:chromosomal replication initiation ATPase DnaA
MVRGRDHTTVMHALRQAEQRAAGDPDFARILDELSRSVLARGR